jgi:hypothetical protein
MERSNSEIKTGVMLSGLSKIMSVNNNADKTFNSNMVGRRRVHEDGVYMLETKGGYHSSVN